MKHHEKVTLYAVLGFFGFSALLVGYCYHACTNMWSQAGEEARAHENDPKPTPETEKPATPDPEMQAYEAVPTFVRANMKFPGTYEYVNGIGTAQQEKDPKSGSLCWRITWTWRGENGFGQKVLTTRDVCVFGTIPTWCE